jgi:hypothetical protein
MDQRQIMRASDRDRQEVVDLLRGAVADGRLRMDEYVDRMEQAYQAVTCGDLLPLHADLPAPGPAARAPGVAGLGPGAAAPSRWCLTGAYAGLPAVLRVLWAIWLSAVSVNVVVWGLVSITTGHLLYPWPLWVAGPYGAVLFALSAALTAARPAGKRLAAAGRP